MYRVGRARRSRTAVVIAKTTRNQSSSAMANRRSSVPMARRVGHDVTLLFAYGTLRRGAPMHGLLEDRVTWIGRASAAGRLVDLGAFPGLVPALAPGDRVQGDLFAIADAQREALFDVLDRYEGASFERLQQEVEGPDGSVIAWVYTWRGAFEGCPVIDGGDYLRTQQQ
jgi:gamma-glutamylcyclotransferase (GGCT)/AIG2-like uncharacterized protein YtfP